MPERSTLNLLASQWLAITAKLIPLREKLWSDGIPERRSVAYADDGL